MVIVQRIQSHRCSFSKVGVKISSVPPTIPHRVNNKSISKNMMNIIFMFLGRGFLLFTFTKLSCVFYRKIYFEVYPPLKLLNSE